MANAANTGSTLYGTPSYANVNKTSTAVSTNIIIMVNTQAVGAVQTLQIQEKRTIKMIDEVGTDGHIDSVPVKSTDIGGSCKRVRFDRLRIAEAFSRGFIHVASQVYPFDIMIFDKQKRNVENQICTIIKNVWITGIDYNYEVGDWVITDTMTWEAESISSILSGSSADAVAVGGELGIKHMGSNLNGVQIPSLEISGRSIEQLVDTGFAGRRGSLDAAGLIDIGDSGQLF